MGNIKFTGEHVHEMFCQIVGCNKKDDLYIKSFDDMGYYNKINEIGADDTDSSSLYWYPTPDSGAEFIINGDLFSIQPYSSTELLLMQMMEVYSNDIAFFRVPFLEASKIKVIKGAVNGYWYWFNFASSFMSMKLLKQIFSDIESSELDSTMLQETYMQAFECIQAGESDADSKLSAALYMFGKIAYFDSLKNENIITLADLRKTERFNVKTLISGKSGKTLDSLYAMLLKSTMFPLRPYEFIRLNSLTEKVKKNLSGEKG